jgi:hypothetical protein
MTNVNKQCLFVFLGPSDRKIGEKSGKKIQSPTITAVGNKATCLKWVWSSPTSRYSPSRASTRPPITVAGIACSDGRDIVSPSRNRSHLIDSGFSPNLPNDSLKDIVRSDKVALDQAAPFEYRSQNSGASLLTAHTDMNVPTRRGSKSETK